MLWTTHTRALGKFFSVRFYVGNNLPGWSEGKFVCIALPPVGHKHKQDDLRWPSSHSFTRCGVFIL